MSFDIIIRSVEIVAQVEGVSPQNAATLSTAIIRLF